MPRITINHLDSRYEQILKSIDQRFHNYALTPECERMSHGLSEAQKGEIETASNYAAHAGKHSHAADLYDENGVHLERRVG
jgi:hypothetical protein